MYSLFRNWCRSLVCKQLFRGLFLVFIAGCSSTSNSYSLLHSADKENSASTDPWVQYRSVDTEFENVWERLPEESPCPSFPIRKPTFASFHKESQTRLIRHLATSAKWHLTLNNGKLVAIRRSVVQGNWSTNLHGFINYSSQEFLAVGRILIYPSGLFKDSQTNSHFSTAKHSDYIDPKFVFDKNVNTSYASLSIGENIIDVYESTRFCRRSFTERAIYNVTREIEDVLASNVVKWRGFDPKLMPSISVREDHPDMRLRQISQKGIYEVDAFVNPGEFGYVFLKITNMKTGLPVLSNALPSRSVEYTGWSHNPRESFFYNTQITIYEGDWKSKYLAKFELWFRPVDTKKPERKLFEKTFPIYGWQQ